MANDNPGPILTGALFAAGGVAGYLAGRWIVDRFILRNEAGDAAIRTDSPRALLPPRLSAPSSDAPGGGISTHLPAWAAPPLSRRFDPIFELHRGAIPLEYLRVLAMRESSMNPGEQSGPAWGLLQVIEAVRLDYNRAHRTSYARADLLDPAVNVAVATGLLRSIIASYRKNHPAVPNLQPDWDNSRFVELLTFGWNAGYSEAGGVGRVAHHLEAQGRTDLTIDLVHEHAKAAGASRHLSRADKVSWCKGVVALYQLERRRSQFEPTPAA